jgi:tRNA(Ile)-lysidine synthase
VSLEIRRVDVAPERGESLEAVARERRYEAMADLLGAGDLLVTAQHRDDQAETLLLALMRGSGPKGLAAMPRVATLGAGRLVRPLLQIGRAELLYYARSQGLDWVEDPGNRELGFDRNFLRQRVLPLLAERWPASAVGIARSAGHCAEAQALIDLFATDELTKAAGGRPGTLSIVRLAKLALPLQKAVVRQWIRGRALAPPDSRHLDRILSEAMTARADANPLVAWPGCEVRRYRDDLFAFEPLPTVPDPPPIGWTRGALSLPNGLGCLELLTPGGRVLDPLDLFPGGLSVRFGAVGLSCRGRPDGHRRPLRKLFQEAGVPPWARPFIPLLFAERMLVAVGDTWVCHPGSGMGDAKFQVRWESDLRLRLPLSLQHSLRQGLYGRG